MYSTYEQLVQYWEAIPQSVVDLQGVTVGNDQAIEDLQNTRIQYPHLWVETPDVRFTGTDDNPATRFTFRIAVLENEPLRKPEKANRKLSYTLLILQSVWAQLIKDADQALFDLILSDADSDPIIAWSGDNAYGWRLQVTIDLPRYECDVLPYAHYQ